ncbi:hypothetical protein, partial [Brevundimonas sp.]|uniref:hypothetical protein n=1 Tax=Brevundimonas sp. TaxID=1871086 RepID=UPI002AB9A719
MTLTATKDLQDDVALMQDPPQRSSIGEAISTELRNVTLAASFRTNSGEKRQVPIRPTLFDCIRASDDGLGHILDIEEAYEINLGNYVDFERGVTAHLAKELVHPAFDYPAIDDARRTVGRLLDNLLGSSFSFLEQTRRRMTRLGGRPLFDAFRAACADLETRFPVLLLMEAIRNHAQHDGSGVSGITLGGRRLEEGDDCVVERTLVATFRKDEVHIDRKWPAERKARLVVFLAELADDKGRIQMGPMVRRSRPLGLALSCQKLYKPSGRKLT